MSKPGEEADDCPPQRALELYLDARSEDVSATTLRSHEYRLEPFVEWCEDNDVRVMRHLNGRLLFEYRQWRKDDGDLNTVSLHTQLSTLRVFLKFCYKLDVVDDKLHEALQIPKLRNGEDQRDTRLSKEHAETMLSYLRRFEYASFDHVLMLLLWRTGMRIGAIQSLDIDDYDRDEARLTVAHRPERGTTLKMGEGGERIITLRDDVCSVIDDWLETTRPNVERDNGRDPLLATSVGRPCRSTIRRHVYRCTQPCQRTGECPHDRTMDDCDDVGYSCSNGCPSTVSPHDVRRGAITHWLSKDIPKDVVGDRANVKGDVLDRHYDKRAETTKAEQRRRHFEGV